MRIKNSIFTVIILLFSLQCFADKLPTINPTATVEKSDGNEVVTSYSGSAPLKVVFEANAENADGWSAYYEWRLTEEVSYKEEYWGDVGAINISISESKLDMPNAFSPNDDGINDIYKAKEGFQSITEFHAYIFNRWGQKLFEWTNPAEGWDGTFNGKPVKQGVYFVLVEAKGADGRKYNIRKDVNLLRGFTEGGVRNNSEQ